MHPEYLETRAGIRLKETQQMDKGAHRAKFLLGKVPPVLAFGLNINKALASTLNFTPLAFPASLPHHHFSSDAIEITQR